MCDVMFMVNRDTRGRVKGYKRLFDIGMEIEQAGELMNTGDRFSGGRSSTPTWLRNVGGHGWHSDGSGPMEFSLPVAQKNLASMFVKFAEGVPAANRWKWHNTIPRGNTRAGSGCGSHIHFGTKQGVNQDASGDSLSQITIFYNTAVSFLPFATKWYSWGANDTMRDHWARWCSISGLQRLAPDSVQRELRKRQGSRGSYSSAGFMIWNKRSKAKCTLELRVNEAMPQWALAFTDVFLLIANRHIEIGDSPKLKNHRRTMERIHNDITHNGKIHDMLDEYMEFYAGRELRTPVPHIIGEKFPTRMKVREFLQLIDRIAYWVFAYSSRKYYTKQLRFRALGGDVSRLPVQMAWEPWKYTIRQLFEGTGQSMPTPAKIKEMFPKVVKRTHTPFAHVRMGENRLPAQEEGQDTEAELEAVDPQDDSLRDLIDLYGTNREEFVEVEFDELREQVRASIDTDYNSGTNVLLGCNQHRRQLSHSCENCLSLHNIITSYGVVCTECVSQETLQLETRRVYTCHHQETNIVFSQVTQEISGCQQCTRAFHQEQHTDSLDTDGSGCSTCLVKMYQYLLNIVLPIVRERW